MLGPSSTRGASARWLPLGVPCLSLACADVGPAYAMPMPEVLATSRYIEYGTWADDSTVCMDDELARADRYVEDIAAFLEVAPPPPRSIRYLYVPPEVQDPERTWPCSNSACFWEEGSVLKDRSVIYSTLATDRHELAHAVVYYGLGLDHRVIEEGLADYLSRTYSTDDLLEDFPQRFKAAVEAGGAPESYRVAAHFVGSLLARHGVAAFKQFKGSLAADAGLDDFAATYASVYAEDLELALNDMAATPIRMRYVAPCDDAGEPIAWPVGSASLQTTLIGECGDLFFHSPGAVEGDPWYFGQYLLDVPLDAVYDFKLTGDRPGKLFGELVDCQQQRAAAVAEGHEVRLSLSSGRHMLRVEFPPHDEQRGAVALSLVAAPSP